MFIVEDLKKQALASRRLSGRKDGSASQTLSDGRQVLVTVHADGEYTFILGGFRCAEREVEDAFAADPNLSEFMAKFEGGRR